MVRAGGVEPPRAYTHCHLKTARLPFRHARKQSISLHLNCEVNKSACRGLWSNVLALVDVLWFLGVRGVQPAGETRVSGCAGWMRPHALWSYGGIFGLQARCDLRACWGCTAHVELSE